MSDLLALGLAALAVILFWIGKMATEIAFALFMDNSEEYDDE